MRYFKDFYLYLKNNLVDPKNRGKDWVFSATPTYFFKEELDYTLPTVVVQYLGQTYKPNTFKSKRVKVRFQVDIYADSMKNLDDVGEQVENLINQYSTSRLVDLNISSSDYDIIIFKNKQVHRRTYIAEGVDFR